MWLAELRGQAIPRSTPAGQYQNGNHVVERLTWTFLSSPRGTLARDGALDTVWGWQGQITLPFHLFDYASYCRRRLVERCRQVAHGNRVVRHNRLHDGAPAVK